MVFGLSSSIGQAMSNFYHSKFPTLQCSATDIMSKIVNCARTIDNVASILKIMIILDEVWGLRNNVLSNAQGVVHNQSILCKIEKRHEKYLIELK